MAKVTSKLQVTVPKAIADRYGIRPGDEIEWIAAGDAIRVVPRAKAVPHQELELRLQLFDAATERQARRQADRTSGATPDGRGWTREELYNRARPD